MFIMTSCDCVRRYLAQENTRAFAKYPEGAFLQLLTIFNDLGEFLQIFNDLGDFLTICL